MCRLIKKESGCLKSLNDLVDTYEGNLNFINDVEVREVVNTKLPIDASILWRVSPHICAIAIHRLYED